MSNLHIATLSLGVPLLRSSSAELVLHHYWQDEAEPRLRDTNLDADPLGRHRTIGQELDLVIGLEEWEQLEVELVGALFRGGKAFDRGSGEFAYGGFVRMDWNF